MQVKQTIALLFVISLLVTDPVLGDFSYNHPHPQHKENSDHSKHHDLNHGLKCVPGRTIIKITEKHEPEIVPDLSESNSDEYRMKDSRKTHTRFPWGDEGCEMCVCSASGNDEFCFQRPARNTNECLMIKDMTKKYNQGLPFDHTTSLAHRIRRDYIWHNDEIPYQATAKCFRGHSYYSNSITANGTDIDLASDVESLLDYNNENTCFFCVCSADGEAVGCIHRDVSFCNFYRVIRSDKSIRDHYTSLLGQDRPTYFRQLSWRLRRTMDNGIFDFINAVNTDGSQQSTKNKCIPFVSQYTDCNDDNLCSGCNRCMCTGDGEWDCKELKECDDPREDERKQEDDDEIFDNALDMLEFQMDQKRQQLAKVANHPNVPAPNMMEEQDQLLAPFKSQGIDAVVLSLLRTKRSVKKNRKRSADKPANHTKAESHGAQHPTHNSHNVTNEVHDSIDDLNEETLKNSNLTGTLVAKKVDMLPPAASSRRSGYPDNSSKALQIEYNQPKVYHHITDNKLETTEQENKFDTSHENLKMVLGNYTQQVKNKELSKIVVNEITKGSEVIGDASAPVISNITFTPENDTLTAMTFIAGNLLNKLWNMEKDAAASSMETDILKKEKIADLLDLFKEPLNLRQETFLKNALEQLSSAIDKHKELKNISLCETLQEAAINSVDTLANNATTISDEEKHEITTKAPCPKKNSRKNLRSMEINKNKATIKAIAKINNVLDLIRKFEKVQSNLSELKYGAKLILDNNSTVSNKENDDADTKLTKDENNSLNTFGSVLEKITKLILPKNNGKKISNLINSQTILTTNDNLKKKFKTMYNIDLTNMTVTAKDKLILDYLTHVSKNPDCILHDDKDETVKIPTIGEILLNLSDFYKLKSFSELVKLLQPEKFKNLRTPDETHDVESTTKENELKNISSKGVDSSKLNATKEKLKAHLKTIIEDLMELQSAKGVSLKGNIKITDALPCIYNVLNAGRDDRLAKKEEDIDPAKKVANIFKKVKKEMKTVQSRRNAGDIMTQRPKSAAVWDRLIKNLNSQPGSKNRRSSDGKIPKSYDKIKEMMEKMENGSSTYKHFALLVKVPATGKLMLLKALQQDVQATIDIINDMNLSFDNLIKLPAEKYAELVEFVDNMASGIKISEKVNGKVKQDFRKFFVNEINTNNKISKTKIKKKRLRASEAQNDGSDEVKVSRTQIVNQLIRNRMKIFMKMKQESGANFNQDMSYNIAQRIIYYLDTGNSKLANELFKVFVQQKENKLGTLSDNEADNEKYIVTSTPRQNAIPLRRMGPIPMELLQDPAKSRPGQMDFTTQDLLIKQLLSIKSMGL